MRAFRFSLLVSVALAGLGAFGLVLAPRAPRVDEIVVMAAEDPDPQREATSIAGLWSRFPDARGEGDPVRFYFFHPSGIGLYRFCKVGLNTTQSFDWRIAGDDLVLTFRKSGVVSRSGFAINNRTGVARLFLDDDPKEPLLHSVGYTFVPPGAAAGFADLIDLEARADGATGIGGRLWMDLEKHATGGSTFSLYQLKNAAIDGRGVGWHHIGDFDDWSTEALSYRDAGATLDLLFTVRSESGRTPMKREGDVLTLVEDPRTFWHVRRYKDAGPSFGAQIF